MDRYSLSMKIFLDTADIDLIGQYYGTGLIDGVTTNPTLIKKSGKDLNLYRLECDYTSFQILMEAS